MLKTISTITNAIGALNFKGTWDANANSPALASSVGTKGDYYVVGTAGTTNLNGISNWGVGDWATFNGSVWQRVEGGADLNGVNLTVSGTSLLSGNTGVGGDTTGVVAGVTVTSKFCVKNEGANPVAGFVHVNDTTANSGSNTFACRSRGTLAVPTIVQNNDSLWNMYIAGNDGTDLALAAEIRVEVDGTPGSNDMPGRILLRTTPDGSQAPVDAVKIDSAQKATFFQPPILDSLTASTALALDASKNVVSVTNTGTGNNVLATSPTLVTPNLGDASASSIATTTGTNNLTAGASTRFLLELTNTAKNAGDEYAIRSYLGVNNSTSGYHLYSLTGGVPVATINGDGTFGSATNTYGGTSDLKLKQDIVDASNQWEDVKAFKFKKYRFKSNPNGALQLGVIAQELEENSPGLVYETRDEDDEGNDLGTVTKNVKYSILYMKAVVALQEAMTRIEKLEADVAALKG